MFEAKQGMSNVWAGITDNAKWLNKGARIAVGNGSHTLFWDHCWATDLPLSDLAHTAIPTEILGATVEEMWETDHGWKWDVFAPYLDANTLKIIQNHEVRVDPNFGDLLYWKGDAKGKFTIRSSLAIMRHQTDVIDDECWNLIWAAPVQQRIRAFLWLACHDRILGNLNRFKRKLVDDPQCFICGHNEESTLHILRDCAAAKQIWRLVLTPRLAHGFFDQPLKYWFKNNLKNSFHAADEGWPTLFGTVVWWIWRWRNCLVFDRSEDIPIDTGAFLRIRVEEAFRSLNDATTSTNVPRRDQQFISWQPPRDGWYTLNSDGAAKGNPGLAGGGALIRDTTGEFIAGISLNLGICSAFRAEVIALTKGIELAKNLQITHIEVQLDNLACVQLLRQNTIPRGECTHELNTCLQMLKTGFEKYTITHVYREGNRAADWLANCGVSQDTNFNLVSSIPLALRSILEEDTRGVAFPRLVTH